MSGMPLWVKICILAFWMFALPGLVGGFFGISKNELNRGKGRIVYMWVGGQFVLWALFWLICVPCILLELDFPYVVYSYGILSGLLAVCGAAAFLRHWRQNGRRGLKLLRIGNKGNRSFWVIAVALLVLQLVQAVRMTYADGDDAYYVAVSSITANAETMYQKLPYTGGTTGLDIRHGLAPLPMWIAFLSKISGIKTVSVAHVAAPLVLIPMTYMIFYLLGRKLFAGKERRIPLFLIFTELLVLFGDNSFYTVENFMIARSRQGKAALGSIVIPMLFVLLFLLLTRMQEQKGCGRTYWFLLVCVMITGCLCSTMGAVLCCLLLAVTGLCAAVCYRSFRVLFPLALCCLPCVVCALLYLLNG
ncbi:MAG: hypothetical protein IJ794_16220 [Lachnospiraceae bacterium]|nr:hypothetical protein [Lachnospiraceae bacterium]